MRDFPDVKNTEEILEFLSSKDGVSSTEYLFTDVVMPYISKFCDTVETDKSGNLIGMINSPVKDAKTVMVEAHMDRIGLMVTGINADGSLSFTNIGGVDERILPYSEVTVCGKERLCGVIYPCKTEENKLPDINDLTIDIGYNKDAAEQLVSVGDIVILSSDYFKLCGRTVSGAAFDNRAGIVAVLQAISNINKDKLAYNIEVIFSVEEELGLHGVYRADKKADAVIVIDVTHGETRDTKGEPGVFPLGSGAVICRGPSLHYDYTNQLIDICKNNSVPYDIEVASGSSGTTAWAFQTQASGIPSMLVSVPLKYMHTNLETLDLSDVEAVASLLGVALEGGLEI